MPKKTAVDEHVIAFVEEQEAQPCTECGRTVMHSADGSPQPHYRPTAGRAACPLAPPRRGVRPA